MSLFDSLGQRQTPQQMNPQEALAQLRANPAGILKNAGLNVPNGMTDPTQIIQYLVQSGQVTNPRLQMIQQIAGNLFKR